MNLILGLGSLLGLCILVLAAFYKWGAKSAYLKGFDAGFEQGKVAGDNWWIQAESDVDQARVKIWREEAQL